MAAYDFETIWRFDAAPRDVWEAISCAVCWPRWWPGIENVRELEKGDADGVGRLERFIWKGALPYRLHFDIRITRVVTMETIAGVASGDVSGTGVWRFAPEPGGTLVRYQWSVRTARWWLTTLAALAGPLVVWNHDLVMRRGGAGLAGYLDAGRSAAALPG